MDREQWIAGVDYSICHSYIHTVFSKKRWGIWVCKCNYSQKYFVINSLGPFVQASCCSMSIKYKNLPDSNYRFEIEKEALRFMSFLRRFIECKSVIRTKAEVFLLRDMHLKQPYLKCAQNNWDDHSVNYIESICTSKINQKRHQSLELELVCVFNFLDEELENNRHDSYQISQKEFFEGVLNMGGRNAIDLILDNYSLMRMERNHRQFWCFHESLFLRYLVWDHSKNQRLVMSLGFVKK